MRRMCAASAAIVMCLALGGVPALAQEASPSPVTAGVGNVWVTGSTTCTVVTDYTQASTEGAQQFRGRVSDCVWTSSDPRLSGPFSMTVGGDCYGLTPTDSGGACVWWATFEASGWTGFGSSTSDAAGLVVGSVIQTGIGANAGWTFVGETVGSEFSGLLYEGPPPPMEMPAAASK